MNAKLAKIVNKLIQEQKEFTGKTKEERKRLLGFQARLAILDAKKCEPASKLRLDPTPKAKP